MKTINIEELFEKAEKNNRIVYYRDNKYFCGEFVNLMINQYFERFKSRPDYLITENTCIKELDYYPDSIYYINCHAPITKIYTDKGLYFVDRKVEDYKNRVCLLVGEEVLFGSYVEDKEIYNG